MASHRNSVASTSSSQSLLQHPRQTNNFASMPPLPDQVNYRNLSALNGVTNNFGVVNNYGPVTIMSPKSSYNQNKISKNNQQTSSYQGSDMQNSEMLPCSSKNVEYPTVSSQQNVPAQQNNNQLPYWSAPYEGNSSLKNRNFQHLHDNSLFFKLLCKHK